MEVRGIRCQTCGGIIERKFENGDLVVDTSTNRGLYVIGYGKDWNDRDKADLAEHPFSNNVYVTSYEKWLILAMRGKDVRKHLK